MTERTLKRRVGLFMVGVHFLSLLLAVTLFFLGGFTFDQLTTATAIIAPMFAGFTTQVISFFSTSRFTSSDRSRPVTLEYAFLTFATPAVLAGLVWVSMLAQANGLAFTDFEQFKLALVLFEGLFAVYAGRLLAPLFGATENPDRGAPDV